MRFLVKSAFAIALLAASVAVAACASSTDPVRRGVCADVVSSVSPVDTSLTVGSQYKLNATLRCSATGSLVKTEWTWRSSRSDIVTVDASGVVSAVGLGIATVSAIPVQAATAVATAAIRSRPKIDVLTPRIEPVSLMLQPGESVQMKAVVDRDPNARIDWSVGDTAVATIDATGLLRAARCSVGGSSTVTARATRDPVVTATAALSVLAGTGAGC